MKGLNERLKARAARGGVALIAAGALVFSGAPAAMATQVPEAAQQSVTSTFSPDELLRYAGDDATVRADTAADDPVTIIVQLQRGGMQGFSLMGLLSGTNQQRRHAHYKDAIRAIAQEQTSAPAANGQRFNAAADPIEEVRDYYTAFDGFAITAPAGVLEKLRALDGVKAAYIAREFEAAPAMDADTSTGLGNQSALDMTGADTAAQKGDGQVICIIDSGLDVTHEAFSGDLDDAKLAWDEQTAYAKRKLCVQGGSNAAYISEKIPFAYDYGDGDANVVPSLGSLDHGTHVAGIAAANAGQIRGTAPNAQIAVMKVANDFVGSIAEASLLAALDDAASLEPDVLNMSIGSDAGFSAEASSTYGEAFATLEASGCTLCISAGNSYTSAYANSTAQNLAYATDPDQGIVSSPASLDSTLAVASVENAASAPYFTMADGTQVRYTEAERSEGVSGKKFKNVKDGTYEYVDAGYGTKAEVAALKAAHEGNFRKTIVLAKDQDVREDDYTVMTGNRVSNIAELAPAAIVLYNAGKGAREAKAIGGNTTTAVACITYEDGQKLIAAQDKRIMVKQGETLPAEDAYAVDAFSSWGTTPELGLKPEIAAPGGSIYSSVLNGKYGTKSGTSMASPQMAGISALVREYVAGDAKFAGMTDAQRQAVVTQLLMSTARPLANEALDGSYYSPRQQGAGFVSVAGALATPVYLTVEGATRAARPKAELGASAAGTWEFTVTLHNLGTAEQAYQVSTVALSELIEDGKFQQVSADYAGKGIEVAYSGAAFNGDDGTVRVAAKSEASFTVRITCGDTFKAAVADAVNGTFVDGFTMLRATGDSGVDLSVPYLGFYGDWGQVPVFDALYGTGGCARMHATRLVNANTGEVLGINPLSRDAASIDTSRAVVSHAGASDAPSAIAPQTGLLRGVKQLEYSYQDAAARSRRSYDYSYVTKSERNTKYPEDYLGVQPSFAGTDDAGHALPDGAYQLVISATTAGPGQATQTQTLPFVLDTAAPVIRTCELSGDALSITVDEDTYLAGIDFHDPATGAYFNRVLADDMSVRENADGTKTYSVEVALSALQKSWAAAGLSGDMPADVPLCAWDYGLNVTASDADASAAQFTIEDGVLTAYLGSSAHVVIPDGVTSIAASAFEGSTVRSVEIPASVTTIGARAFFGAENLQQVAFADASQLASIGDRAFAESGVLDIALPEPLSKLGDAVFAESQLRSIALPATLTTLPTRAFADSKLERVVLPATLEEIGRLAFSGCKDLREVYTGSAGQNPYELPAALVKIGDSAFEKCGIDELVLPEGLVEIGVSAFAKSNISSLVVPDSVTKLDSGALADMAKMRSVTLGAGVATAQVAGALDGCTALANIYVSAASTQLSSRDGVLYSKDGTSLLLYPQGRTDSYEVPAGTATIGKGAFKGAALRKVVLPAAGIVIEDSAFAGSELADVDLGGTTSIGASAFANCASLTSVDFRSDLNQLASIGAAAFCPGTPLAAVVLPDSVTQVGTGAFASNQALKSVHLGAGVKGSFASMFSGCESIGELSVSAGNAVYVAEGNVLYSKQADGLHLTLSPAGNSFESYVVKDGTTVIEQRAFKNNAHLKSVVLPEGLVEIGAAAFTGCSALESVVFPDSLETVSGFYNTAIQTADFGTHIKAIKSSAFNGHNPAHLIVRGGQNGTYASSLEAGDDEQPIKTAYFGEGMVKADFSASSIAPPSVVVVPASMEKLVFCKPSASLVYDPSAVVVYAPQGSAGWDAAAAALAAIGADADEQLHAFEPLSVTASAASGAAGAQVSVAAQAAGGVGALQYRFTLVSADGSSELAGDWSDATSCAGTRVKGAVMRVEVRDESYCTASCEVALSPNAGSAVQKPQKVDETPAAAVTQVTINVKKVTRAAVKKALGANATTVTKVTLGKKVKKVSAKAFKGTKVTTLVVKTKKLTKKSVKGALKGSKVKTVKVPKAKKKLYKKIFVKKICGAKVKVK